MFLQKCSGACGEEKEQKAVNFYWRKNRNKWHSVCIICWNEREKKRHKNNKEKNNKKKKKYYEENKNIINKKCKKYRNNNKEKIKEYHKKWYSDNKKEIAKYTNNRLKNDLVFRLRKIINRSISAALKRVDSSKNGSILKHLNIIEIKKHIESKFELWMNWQNQGRYIPEKWNDNDSSTWVWQLDHIIPQSDLPYDSMEHPNFKKCWALENLRPLSAKQNLLDGTNKIRHAK